MIAAANYDFVCRYYGHNISKCLGANELVSLKNNNVMIVSIWEDNPTSDGYFSYLNGVNDGSSAYKFATGVNQPGNSAIYFAVDYDAQQQAIGGVISDYFRGVAAGFSAIEAGGASIYSVGVYGSGATCAAIVGANLAQFSWVAQSPGWSGHATFNQWNIRQGSSATLFGLGVDLDDAAANYGAF